MAKRHLSLQAE